MRTHEAQPSESARNFDHCEDEYRCPLECRLPIVVKKVFFFDVKEDIFFLGMYHLSWPRLIQ